GATCFTMLHHVPSPEHQDRLLAELRRVLRPRGLLVGVDSIDRPDWRELHAGDVCVPVDPATLADRLQAAGFVEVEVEGDRETFLSFYGPLSLILLFVVWAIVIIIGFSFLHWATGSGLSSSQAGPVDYGTVVYVSGTTFFTLGLGDVVPTTTFARALTVVEGGTGFGFLALVIGYLPIVYQMFARRETNVSLLDQRAGSPPTVGELLRRNVVDGDMTVLDQLM